MVRTREHIGEKKWDAIHGSLLDKGMNCEDARNWMNKRFIMEQEDVHENEFEIY